MGGNLAASKSAQQPSEQQQVVLPEIRQDLAIYPAEHDVDGSPLWHLHDPLANKYYRMNERDIELLALFGQKENKDFIRLNQLVVGSNVDKEELEELEQFLRMNNLVKGDAAQLNLYQDQLDRARQSVDWFSKYIRKPLFFRFPLWNPDKFLDKTISKLSWLGHKSTLYIFVIITLIGIYLFSRQVDQFFTTFQYFFSWSGMAIYILALAFSKICHEFGHAYVAKAHGCKVPMFGVALMMGWPILYTDTTDSWKIASRVKRIQIGAAGVAVELVIASLSLFLWSISPEGSIKSALFLLSTTTWIMSIFVNFNPFMRFDGYYLMSDFLRVPNLEQRSFGMAKWWLRERLFACGIEPPEHFRPVLVVYAYCVWIYRLMLFMGITYIVYTMFFKVLGVALFISTLLNFLIKPVLKEIMVWWEMRDKIKWNHSTIRTSAIFLFLLGLIFIPWQRNVPVAAVMRGQIADLYIPEAGQLLSMPINTVDMVEETEILFELTSPQLERDIEQATSRYTELRWTQASQGWLIGKK
jgi:putative peptide zinc metalloprotease protein